MVRKKQKRRPKNKFARVMRGVFENIWPMLLSVMGAAVVTGGMVYFLIEGKAPSSPPSSEKKVPVHKEEETHEPVAVKDVPVKLYYYNWALEKESWSHESLAPERMLAPVIRKIPRSQTPVQDTIRLLLQERLSAQEQDRGFFTEFPLLGLELIDADLNGGTLTLRFANPEQLTLGGSHRSMLLRAQIEQTAMQFDKVEQVRYKPEGLFEP